MSNLLPYFVARSNARMMDREGWSTRIFQIVLGIPFVIAVIGVTYLLAEFVFVLGRALVLHLLGR